MVFWEEKQISFPITVIITKYIFETFYSLEGAEELIVKHSHANFKKFDEQKKADELAKQKKKEKEDAKKKAAEVISKDSQPQPQPAVIKKVEPIVPIQNIIASNTEDSVSVNNEENKKEEKEEKRGLPGNGGKTDKYTWTQTLEEVAINTYFLSSYIMIRYTYIFQ